MNCSINIKYNKDANNNLLSKLCDEYKSDKGSLFLDTQKKSFWPWPPHTYTDFYSLLFDHCRHSIKNVFELGIGTNDESLASNMTKNGIPGSSLRVWQEYFFNAKIVGADIDEKILFKEARIKTYLVDQTSKVSIETMWKKIKNNFDIIIDDGLHEYNANITFFENSFHKLKSNGIYIIEDITKSNLNAYEDYFIENNFNFMSVDLYRSTKNNILDYNNCLIVIMKAI